MVMKKSMDMVILMATAMEGIAILTAMRSRAYLMDLTKKRRQGNFLQETQKPSGWPKIKRSMMRL